MSYDTIDMLEAAEDRIGLLSETGRAVIAAYTRAVYNGTGLVTPNLFEAVRELQVALDIGYCRCEMETEEANGLAYDPIPDTCTNEYCGCPCGHPWRKEENEDSD